MRGAPLKFMAPGITTPLGLGIGRLVFRALKAVELAIACVLVVVFVRQIPDWPLALLGIVFTILLVQTFWLRPALDDRALRMIAGEELPPSSLHLADIALGREADRAAGPRRVTRLVVARVRTETTMIEGPS